MAGPRDQVRPILDALRPMEDDIAALKGWGCLITACRDHLDDLDPEALWLVGGAIENIAKRLGGCHEAAFTVAREGT